MPIYRNIEVIDNYIHLSFTEGEKILYQRKFGQGQHHHLTKTSPLSRSLITEYGSMNYIFIKNKWYYLEGLDLYSFLTATFDNKYLYFGSYSQIVVYKIETKEITPLPLDFGFFGFNNKYCVSQDRKYFAIKQSGSNRVKVFNLETGKIILDNNFTSHIYAMTINDDYLYLIKCQRYRFINLNDLTQNKIVNIGPDVKKVQLSNDGKEIYIFWNDGSCCLNTRETKLIPEVFSSSQILYHHNSVKTSYQTNFSLIIKHYRQIATLIRYVSLFDDFYFLLIEILMNITDYDSKKKLIGFIRSFSKTGFFQLLEEISD